MTREQYKQSVKDIMINKNPYGTYHQQNFNTYGSYDEMTPINSDILSILSLSICSPQNLQNFLSSIFLTS